MTPFDYELVRLRRHRPRRLVGRARTVILQFIVDRSKIKLPPTVREIMDHLGFNSPNGIHQHLKALKKKGLINYEDGKARTITPRFKFIPASELEVKHEQTNPTL